MPHQSELRIIGRVETVGFPELNLPYLEAKIDTGAYSTALHCHKIWLEEENGQKVLHFDLLDPDHSHYQEGIAKANTFSRKKVKSSNGKMELRYIIKTKIKIGKKYYRADVSLTDRRKMKYPVLVGRKLLKKKFLVDVSKEHLLKKSIQQKAK